MLFLLITGILCASDLPPITEVAQQLKNELSKLETSNPTTLDSGSTSFILSNRRYNFHPNTGNLTFDCNKLSRLELTSDDMIVYLKGPIHAVIRSNATVTIHVELNVNTKILPIIEVTGEQATIIIDVVGTVPVETGFSVPLGKIDVKNPVISESNLGKITASNNVPTDIAYVVGYPNIQVSHIFPPGQSRVYQVPGKEPKKTVTVNNNMTYSTLFAASNEIPAQTEKEVQYSSELLEVYVKNDHCTQMQLLGTITEVDSPKIYIDEDLPSICVKPSETTAQFMESVKSIKATKPRELTIESEMDYDLEYNNTYVNATDIIGTVGFTTTKLSYLTVQADDSTRIRLKGPIILEVTGTGSPSIVMELDAEKKVLSILITNSDTVAANVQILGTIPVQGNSYLAVLGYITNPYAISLPSELRQREAKPEDIVAIAGFPDVQIAHVGFLENHTFTVLEVDGGRKPEESSGDQNPGDDQNPGGDSSKEEEPNSSIGLIVGVTIGAVAIVVIVVVVVLILLKKKRDLSSAK
ncbi:hypothetical protein TRFO_42688 [Tritrichomonas foetus]|uniref:Uncharacterized protein n=1 Tax=Tritrichomonas foetus TaxID=1144522 RepID=A0A1J4KV77_9EUKA|nr:hypothetical protein TRFO_42688 [Tritrichomonas foetus]|eukprot:OHT15139.1 hypothetical protein TRFO_42688 [Tritrichomonas foetus]